MKKVEDVATAIDKLLQLSEPLIVRTMLFLILVAKAIQFLQAAI